MKLKHISIFLLLIFLWNCKEDSWQLKRIEGKQISISDSLDTKAEIDAFIEPYRIHVNKELDSVISYSMDTYSKSDGELNTAIGNLFADAIYEEANPVFLKRTGKNIDMVLVNHGGIRSIISKGDITTRTAFELMPFENSVVVAAIKGSNINQLVAYLASAKRAHPISKLKVVLDSDYNVTESTISGKPIDTSRVYYVATNDYLYNGGDRMLFFKPSDSLYVLNYKVRNVLLDHFKKTDTIRPEIDNRFIQLKK